MLSPELENIFMPEHLAGKQSVGLVANQTIAQYELGPLKNFCYLILDWKTKKAAAVDPQKHPEIWLKPAIDLGFELEWIFLTHTHHDHISGLDFILRQRPDLPICLHREDLHRIQTQFSRAEFHLVRDEEVLRVGQLSVQALHTPGHSPGEVCYWLPHPHPYLLTGDTLFIRDCGRTDFVGGSNSQMFASLQRIKKLPTNTIILPGHHYAPECASTLAVELQTSPPLLCSNVEELARLE